MNSYTNPTFNNLSKIEPSVKIFSILMLGFVPLKFSLLNMVRVKYALEFLPRTRWAKGNVEIENQPLYVKKQKERQNSKAEELHSVVNLETCLWLPLIISDNSRVYGVHTEFFSVDTVHIKKNTEKRESVRVRVKKVCCQATALPLPLEGVQKVSRPQLRVWHGIF
jgi:uncharacterized protein (DUF2132 family)